CDLVPSWATKGWLHVLSREYPTLAFHASVTNPFGKVLTKHSPQFALQRCKDHSEK
ncbi:hypothetical protein GOP47_0030838, partial [Adiantum capillus-veneris]